MRKWIKLIEQAESQAEQMVDAFYEAFEKTEMALYVSVSLSVQKWNEVELSLIRTKPESRKEGWATRAMTMLVDFADQYDVVLSLGIAHDADGRNNGLTQEELYDWYSRWGFEGGQSMKRIPS